jgi:N-acetyl-gamma-glutamyl-phosphate reductase
MSRGILTTLYGNLVRETTDEEVTALYEKMYGGAPFVRILDKGQLPSTIHVRGTNYCDIGWRLEPRTGRIIVITAIDNLVRGAAGQAIANMNLMCGFAEEIGLNLRAWQP